MSKVSVSQEYNASANAVWDVIGDPAGISSWHPAIASSPVEGAKNRVCTLTNGAKVIEEIIEHDDAQRRYRYRIVKSPLPMTDYVASISVSEMDGGSKVTWDSEFNATGDAIELEEMIRGLYEAGLGALTERL